MLTELLQAIYYAHKGGGGNYHVVTEEQENFAYGLGTTESSYIYGVEYQTSLPNLPSTSSSSELDLMAERYNHHRSTFECVDEAAETVAGGQADQNGAVFCHVEPRCGSLPCPPYEEQKEMTCAISTRKNKP